MLININASAINTTSTAADVQTVTKIQDLSDVDIPNPLDNGNLLIWNGSTMNWENSNTVDNDLTVTGNMIPYTLPNKDVPGDYPHVMTRFYIKHDHHK